MGELTNRTKYKIHQKVLAYCKAVENQDHDAFQELFYPDATLISIASLYDGIDEIAGNFLGKIKEVYQSIRLIPEEITVSLRDENTAVVTFKYHTECIRRDDGSEYGISGLETQVFLRSNCSVVSRIMS